MANYGKLSAYSCGGSCGIRAKTRHRIPFSLLIFEETVNSASLKGLGAGLVNGDAPPRADRACGGQSPVYSSDVVGFRMRHAERKTGTRSFKAAAAPATVSGELPFMRSHWSHSLREGGRDARTRKPVDRPVTSNLNRPRVEGRGRIE